MAIWANQILRAGIDAMQSAAETIARDQSLMTIEDRIVPVKEIFRLQGASELQEAMECGVGGLNGFVRDVTTGQNIGAAKVIVLPGNFAAVTDHSSPFGTTGGKYRIENIPEGTYVVTATKEGYEANTQDNVMISPDVINSVNVGLNPE